MHFWLLLVVLGAAGCGMGYKPYMTSPYPEELCNTKKGCGWNKAKAQCECWNAREAQP